MKISKIRISIHYIHHVSNFSILPCVGTVEEKNPDTHGKVWSMCHIVSVLDTAIFLQNKVSVLSSVGVFVSMLCFMSVLVSMFHRS